MTDKAKMSYDEAKRIVAEYETGKVNGTETDPSSGIVMKAQDFDPSVLTYDPKNVEQDEEVRKRAEKERKEAEKEEKAKA